MATNGTLRMSGEFLSLRPGKAWTGRDGEQRTPWIVRVLVGDYTYQVEYRDEESATAAVAGLDRGDAVDLPVYARAKGKDWLTFIGRAAS